MSPLPFLLALAAGCAHAPTARERAAASAEEEPGVIRVRAPGLRDVACSPEVCFALTSEGLRAVPAGSAPSIEGITAFDVLRHGSGGFTVEGPCATGRCARSVTLDPPALGPETPLPEGPAVEDDAPPLEESAARFAAAFNDGTNNRRRVGFFRLIVGPGGGLISWTRGLDDSGQLMRVGTGSAFVRVPAASAPVSYPAWLALHPTGIEGYLLPWPSPVLTAFDPMSLRTRWSLSLDDPAHGLFVDAGGRYLVAALGPPDTDRLVDWPILAPAGEDPFRDEHLRDLPRPPVSAVVAVDLASHQVALRARGSYRRWLVLPDGRIVLATDREVVFLSP